MEGVRDGLQKTGEGSTHEPLVDATAPDQALRMWKKAYPSAAMMERVCDRVNVNVLGQARLCETCGGMGREGTHQKKRDVVEPAGAGGRACEHRMDEQTQTACLRCGG